MGEGRSILTDAKCLLSHGFSGDSLKRDQLGREIVVEVMFFVELINPNGDRILDPFGSCSNPRESNKFESLHDSEQFGVLLGVSERRM